MKNIGILLAAGKGTRMKSSQPKVLHEVAGQAMCCYPFEILEALCDKIVIVVGYQAELVEKTICAWIEKNYSSRKSKDLISKRVLFVKQKQQRGTGHAVKTVLDHSRVAKISQKNNVMILNGDLPLLKKSTLSRSWNQFKKTKALDIVCLSSVVDDPKGLGRVVRDDDNKFLKIVECKDASKKQKEICEINTGVYFAQYQYLAHSIKNLKSTNKQNEFYVTDLLQKNKSEAFLIEDACAFLGVNDQWQLAQVNKIAQQNIVKYWAQEKGVYFDDPQTCYVDKSVQLSSGVRVGPQVKLLGQTKISSQAVLEGNHHIKNSKIGKGTQLLWGTVVDDSIVGDSCRIGPYARLRPGSRLKNKVKLGNFVETKNALLKEGAKASHLSYLGDCSIGKNTNISCGVIFCNYDGIRKHFSTLGDDVFVGSDSQIISPVSIGKGSFIASGSSVEENIPADTLCIPKREFINKKSYVKKWMKKKRKQK